MTNTPSPDRVEIHLKPIPTFKLLGLTIGGGVVLLLLAYGALSHTLHLSYAPRYIHEYSYRPGDLLTFVINNVPAPVQLGLLSLGGVFLCLTGLLPAFRFLTSTPIYVIDGSGIRGGYYRSKHLPWANVKLMSFNAGIKSITNLMAEKQLRIYGTPQSGGKTELQFGISMAMLDVNEEAIKAITKRYRPDLPI